MLDGSARSPSGKGKICAVGYGTMGLGTALTFACYGYDVCLTGRSKAKLEQAARTLPTMLEDLVDHGLVGARDVVTILNRITTTTDLVIAARDSLLVMESIAEDMAVKQTLFRELDLLCPQHTRFATNTSALDPTEIFSVLPECRASQCVVAHGFNPPGLMQVVEVVPGLRTSQETMDWMTETLTEIGKIPVRLQKASPGFIVNYIQVAILWEAMRLHVERRFEPDDIDTAFKEKLGKLYQNNGPLLLAGHNGEELTQEKAILLRESLNRDTPKDHVIVDHLKHAGYRAALNIVANGTASAVFTDYAFVHSLGRRYAVTGPLESADLGGLDIFQSILRTLGYLRDATALSAYLEEKVSQGDIGTKSTQLKGFHIWTPDRVAGVKARRNNLLIATLKAHMTARIPASQRRSYRPPQARQLANLGD